MKNSSQFQWSHKGTSPPENPGITHGETNRRALFSKTYPQPLDKTKSICYNKNTKRKGIDKTMKIHYVANDGEIFLSPEDCVRYEMLLKEKKEEKMRTSLPMMWNDDGERTYSVASAVIIKATNLYELRAFIDECKKGHLDCGIEIDEIWGNSDAIRRFIYSFDEDRFMLVDNDLYEAMWNMMRCADSFEEV
jgi:hypothetical protein